jgi:hypothetical protein
VSVAAPLSDTMQATFETLGFDQRSDPG